MVGPINGRTPRRPATSVCSMPARVLVVDNYDSFVYNLVQYLGQLGAEPIVRRNDALELEEVAELDICGALISPARGGPKTPASACL